MQVFHQMNPQKWVKSLFLQAFPPNEPPKLSKKPIFTGFSTEMNPQNWVEKPIFTGFSTEMNPKKYSGGPPGAKLGSD